MDKETQHCMQVRMEFCAKGDIDMHQCQRHSIMIENNEENTTSACDADVASDSRHEASRSTPDSFRIIAKKGHPSLTEI